MKVEAQESEQLLLKIDFNQARFQLPYQVQEEGIITQITLYRSPIWKQIFFGLTFICTGGLAYLFMRWELWFRIFTLFYKSRIQSATYVLVKSQDGTEQLIEMKLKTATLNGERKQHKTFEYRLYTYFLDEIDDIFKPMETTFHKMTNTEIIEQYCRGISDPILISEQFGFNDTTIPDKTTLQILIDEILSPFYLFQIFSVILWSIEEYYSYAAVIFLTSVISVIINLRETKSNFQKLRQMTAQDTIEILYRGQNPITLENKKEIIINSEISQNKQLKNSKEIVPGDLIEVRDGWTVPCDCILLNGACIINESMLTGESIPILKNSIPYNDKLYQMQEDSKSYTLFAGTKCLETRYSQKGKIPVLAMAVQTGFSTIKGQLVRSILFPKPTTFSFYRDSLMFIGVLAMMAILGFLLTIKDQYEEYISGNLPISQMVINSLDLITITVPPALPTCLSIGVTFALGRLLKKQIVCISPNRVNVAGKITIMCFDKTGTLTEDGLDLYGVRPIGYSDKKSKLCFQDLIVEMKDLREGGQEFSFDDKKSIYGHTMLQPKGIVLEIMASCHGLARVDGILIGDPLEVKMFEATETILDDIQNTVTNSQGQVINIIRRFEFSSTLQRMSVIVGVNGKLRVHVKGSPEKLRELCNPSSIPPSFHKILDFYSKLGFRVLACGSKSLISECSREQAECNLTFMGFLIMQNKLKKATKKAIETLQDACIRTIMVTGDNVLTAISVARQCHLVQPNQRIFLGDIAEDRLDGRNHIIWKDFDQNDNMLDPDNLSPEMDIKDDPDADDDLIWNKENPDRMTLEIILDDNILNAAENNFSRKSQKLTKSKYMSYKEQQQQLKMENLDHLIDDQDPWKTEEPFVIAISGKAFDLLHRQVDSNPKARKVFGKMLERAQIFARMKPEQKALLIQLLQTISRKSLCGMCGDGANDCGALKAADVGISLSDAEASIAAPFTSKIQDISCVIKLLREGRASLVTSFQCFKYMALYSMIQFCTVTLLYQVIANLSDYQFLFIDLFIIIPLAGTMGQTKAYKQLTQFQPGSNLISFPVLMSVIGQTIIQVTAQCIVYYTLTKQSWYVDAVSLHEDIGDADDHFALEHSFENTTMFLFANFQYVFQCLAFSIGKPFRQPFYTNLYFTVWITILFLFNFYNLYFSRYPKEILSTIFKFYFCYEGSETMKKTEMPFNWFYFLSGIMGINFLVCILFEKYAVPIVTRYYRAKKRLIVKRYRFSENPYLK